MPVREPGQLGAPCWVDLMTSDQDAARAFYGPLFGWQAEEPNMDFGGYVNFTKDGVRIAGCMGASEPDQPANFWTTYLEVADAQATADAAAAHGGTVVMPTVDIADMGRMSMVIDPGGAAVGIWQPGTHPGFGFVAEPGAPAWFEVHTRAYQPVIDFYASVFGWDVHTMSDTPEFRYSTFGEGEAARAGIMDDEGHLPPESPPHWAVYFAVADTDASLATAVELGGTAVMDPVDTPYGRVAGVADPTGATFMIVADGA